MAAAPPPPPPRASSSSTRAAPASVAVPPPPRSSAASPLVRTASPGPTPSSPTLSRPGTPSGGRPAKPVPMLSVPNLMHDLASLKGTDLLRDFAGVTSDEGPSLDNVRAGTVDLAALDRTAAVHLADGFVAEMDALLNRASEVASSTAAVDRAEAIGTWAQNVDRGLEA